jgi:putative ABC transport system permease protein
VSGIDPQGFRPSWPDAAGAGPATRSDADAIPALGAPIPPPNGIILNEWAARELSASIGDEAEIEFYVWDAAAGLRTARASFWVTGVVPISGLAADRRLAPEYPGITGADNVADWDPPFPLDLSRIRTQDERYWDDYRATPKAFIPYEAARELWSTRYGQLTSLRFAVPPSEDAEALAGDLRARLRETVEPASQGLVFVPTRRLALESSTGATNFGEYFTYFSFFIVVSALLLALLFFRLGIEGRLRQIGILRAAGYTTGHVRRMLMAEAGALAIAGSVIGVAGAVAYAHLIVYALTTWWVGAVGTTLLEVHVSPISLVAGAVGGVAAALVCVALSLRAVARWSPRALIGAQSLEPAAGTEPSGVRRTRRLAAAAGVIGAALLMVGFMSRDVQAGAFFGAGALLLVAALLFLSSWLRGRDASVIAGRGAWAVSRLGFRGAAFRPGRSVLSAALVAAAAFIIVSVDAFRRGDTAFTGDPQSGTGGFALLAESDVPIVHNPNEPGGREELLIRAPELADVRFARFRMRPGEDASCLNLYRPTNPKIIAPEASFIEENRFTFAGSLAETDEERANPWLLLHRRFDDGSVPVVADATSLQYVLHASIGDTMAIDVGAERPITLRFVAALRDSVLQGEIVMGEADFVRLFPGQEGFRYFLIDAPSVTTRAGAAALAEIVERELQPYGVDAVSTAERLDAFHRVENTYLSTFQALGGLGLLLGTVGLATVMFRNVLERRRELALLRAVGYDGRHVTIMILAETIFILCAGLLAGAGCALIAIAPALADRGGSLPGAGLAILLAAVLAAGVLSAMVATRAAVSGHVLQALRAE